MCLNYVGERALKCVRENRECRWRQIKSTYRWHLDLQLSVSTVLIVQILGLLIVPLFEIKSYGTVFLHKHVFL